MNIKGCLGPFFCNKCGLRPVTDFVYRKAYVYKGKTVYNYRCITCENSRRKEYHHNNTEASRLYLLDWRRKNPIRAKFHRDQFWEKNPEKYQKMLEHMKCIRKETRMRVLQHYSQDIPKCACCGENNYEFLAVDHIHGGGTKHRKQIHRTTHRFSLWLIKNNFPSGYRVLCHNCNFSYGHFGDCPHQVINDM